ncbi:hypothetical protein EKO27_g2351, partial [Xylaria grammica]
MAVEWVDPRPYRHPGVHIPFVEANADRQWSSDDAIYKQGFLFVDSVRKDKVVSVQSVETGQLYINKILEPDPHDDYRDPDEQAQEIRISTAPGAKDLWQDIGNGAYSLYFKFYNGGTLERLTSLYVKQLRPIPEHFIWHVLLTLTEAVRYLHTGVIPGTDDNVADWTQVILGDFESGALEGRGQAIRRGHLQQVEENVAWRDTYAVFSVVKKLCLCHVSYPDYDEMYAPENVPCEEINTYLKEEDTRYSQDLFDLLESWEYPNCAQSDVGMTQKNDKGEEIPNNSLIPGLDYLVRTVLPVARSKVRKYRRPGGDRPGNWYRQLDLSWTKPDRLMPYQWWPEEEIRPANPTGNDDESDDDLDEHGQGNDTSKQEPSSSVKDNVTQSGDQDDDMSEINSTDLENMDEMDDDDEALNSDLSDIINSSNLNINPLGGDNNPDHDDPDHDDPDHDDPDHGDPGDGDQEKAEEPETSDSSDTEHSQTS